MTAITTTQARPVSFRPTIQSRAMSDLIGRFTNRLEDTDIFNRKCISGPIAPRDDERRAMADRRAELLASLQPEAERSRKVLIALLGSFPSYGEDEETARFILAACCRACSKVPTWAIEEASARFLEGRARIPWDMAKRPTPPQILAEALQCALPVEAELHRVSQVLDAEVVDTETTDLERQEALDAWAKLKADMGRSNVVTDRTSDAIEAERAAFRKVNERFDAERLAASEAARKAKVGAEQ